MSLDYPNRAVWLAKRSTRQQGWKHRGRVIWNNGTYVRKKHGPIGQEAQRVR